jgi:hypothetical protein|tara:strand:+ start:902 stop:1531 length:630 start_codon:yes stop_codon:yes gene_type:complete
MAIKKILFFIVIIIPIIAISQVGIGTTTPNPGRALDINGSLVVRDFSRSDSSINNIKLLLAEADGTLIEASFPKEMLSQDTSNNNVITLRHRTELTNLHSVNFSSTTSYNPFYSNPTSSMVRRANSNNGDTLIIKGITGGYDGRTLRIVNDSGLDIEFINQSNEAVASRRIKIYTKEDKMIDYGSSLLIYSTEIEADGRWMLVELDEYN